jgi:4-hydroxy-tetrahydrodipicolinate synthase
MTKELRGVFAALITPLDQNGKIDFDTFRKIVDFIAARGVEGLCIGGGTGEYPHFDLADRLELMRIARERLSREQVLIAAIGSAPIHTTLALGRFAMEQGYDALLVPPPFSYRLQQQDLQAFYEKVIRELDARILVYHYPHFGNAIDLTTIQKLFHLGPRVVGLKDSSGVLENVEAIHRMQGREGRTLLMGDDRKILYALGKGWQGAVSGVASLCPEILCAVYDSFAQGDLAAAQAAQNALDELIVELDRFPFPWAMHLGLPVRGIPTGALAQELSAERKIQAKQFAAWFAGWLQRNNLT